LIDSFKSYQKEISVYQKMGNKKEMSHFQNENAYSFWKRWHAGIENKHD
jgi:hypothetical protein